MVVPEAIRRRLEQHAAEDAPNEACGLLVFRDGQAVRYEPGRNRAASPYRFELDVDPEVWFLEDEGYELAVFHSHPTDSARPSRTDLANIGLWQGRPYFILSAATGELAAWRIQRRERRAAADRLGSDLEGSLHVEPVRIAQVEVAPRLELDDDGLRAGEGDGRDHLVDTRADQMEVVNGRVVLDGRACTFRLSSSSRLCRRRSSR